MDHKPSGSQIPIKGPEQWFTGTVRLDSLFTASDPANAGGASVTSSRVIGPLGSRARSARR